MVAASLRALLEHSIDYAGMFPPASLDLEAAVTNQASYVRLEDDGPRQRFDYTAPRFDFRCVLVYDESGLVLDYPGIASRVA